MISRGDGYLIQQYTEENLFFCIQMYTSKKSKSCDATPYKKGEILVDKLTYIPIDDSQSYSESKKI